jgi:hypothetical protein
MGSLTFNYTFVGGEGYTSDFLAVAIPNFGGTWTTHWHLDHAADRTYNFQFFFRPGLQPNVCFYSGVSFITGQTDQDTATNAVVGVPAGSGIGFWGCTNFDHFCIRMDSSTSAPPVGWKLTVTLTAPEIPVAAPSRLATIVG